MRASVENVEKYVCACVALHTYLRQTNNAAYTPRGSTDSQSKDGTIKPGERRANASSNTVMSVRPLHGSRPREDCVKMINNMKEYLCKPEGSVS